MQTINRDNIRQLRDEMNAALNLVLKKHGVTAVVGNASFTPGDVTFKVKVSVGSADDAAKREWDRYCVMFGLTPDLFGKKFVSRGTEFTITGIAKKGRDYPVLATNDNGTVYKFNIETARGAR